MKKLFFNDYYYLYIYLKRIILLKKALVNNLARSKSENNFIGCLLSTTINYYQNNYVERLSVDNHKIFNIPANIEYFM